MKSLKTILNPLQFHVNYDVSIKYAMSIMIQNKNGCVVLLKENRPFGILTESDIVKLLKLDATMDMQIPQDAYKPIVTVNQNRPIEIAFDVLSKYNIRRLVLIDDHGEYCGVVTQEDLFEFLEEDVYKVDLKIADIIKVGKKVFTVTSKQTIKDALLLMQKYHVGSIVVMENKEYVGIVTEKDILNFTYEEINLDSNIEAYMKKPVIAVPESTLVTYVIELMKVKQIRRVVVLNELDEVTNILTNRDILKHIKGNYSRILQNKIKHAQEIMNFLPEAIIEIFDNEEQQTLYWMNDKAKSIFGEELLDKPVTKIFPPHEWKNIYNEFTHSNSMTHKIIKLNQSTYELSGTLSKNINNNYIKIIFKDVTIHEEQKSQLQQEINKQIQKRLDHEYLMMQQSKLATMGEMIAHIAHQWRQPLAQLGGIFMNFEAAYSFNELTQEYLQDRTEKGNELLKYMSSTIDDFSTFFEPNREKEVFDAALYIQNAINIIEMSLTYHHIQLNFEKSVLPYNILGYPSEFSQVILNILINAKDALCDQSPNERWIEIRLKELNDFLLIEIEDNALGISEDVIDKVFEMYFTTKKQKEGTGLGLYISKLIIETKLNGSIQVFNTQKGARFEIKIPLCKP